MTEYEAYDIFRKEFPYEMVLTCTELDDTYMFTSVPKGTPNPTALFGNGATLINKKNGSVASAGTLESLINSKLHREIDVEKL